MDNKKGYLTLAIILSLGLIISAYIMSKTWKYVSRKDVIISVTGSASKEIKSDIADWDINVTGEAPTLPDAYSKLQGNIDKVKSYLLGKNIKESEIKLSSINKSDVYEGDDGNFGYNNYSKTGSSVVKKPEKKFKGYKLTQTITIESANIDNIENLSRTITELYNQGIDVTPSSPRFLYTKLSDVKLEIISLAAQDAKKRAEEIAKSTDNKIGEIRSSKVGVIQINAKNDFEVTDYGMNDVSSVEKTIRATINVSYSI